MITAEEMKRFLTWPAAPEERVLSVYLNIEPSGSETLHRRFEVAYESLMQSFGKKADQKNLAGNLQHVRRFLSDFEPAARGLVIFSEDSQNYFWTKELKVHVKSQAYWLDRPYILPLLEAFDEYKRYGVILVDKEKARIFTYSLREIEEEEDAIAVNDVNRFKTSGKDNIRSAFKLQRTVEIHEEWHLKHAVQLMEEIRERKPFDRLLVGGSKEAVEEIIRILPPDLESKFLGSFSSKVDTDNKTLLYTLDQVENDIERKEEMKIADRLLHEEHAKKQRVLGVEGVLFHLDRKEIYQLVYSDTFQAEGGKCGGCGYLFPNQREMCGRCDSAIRPLPNFLEEMARRVILEGGKLEEVRGEAARKLNEAGGVGAFLKERRSR